VAELGGRELLEEWRGVVESLMASASSAAGRTELPRELLAAMRRQYELMQEILEREQRLQRELAGRAVAPFDAVFDLLQQTAVSMRSQGEALERAGAALEESGRLFAGQAELFERTIALLREPAEIAKTAAGLARRTKGAREPGA
jgi:hypothetical protein